MKQDFLQFWQKFSEEDRLAVFQETGKRKGLPAAVIEKDWWVSLTLRIIFTMEIGSHLVFKGGTSLSKAWQLIARFSEDIDLAVDRGFLGFEGSLSKSQVKRLRKDSHTYISEVFVNDLNTAFAEHDVADVKIHTGTVTASDQDPLIIEIYYPGITESIAYVESRVLVEIGSRSLREPFTMRTISSIVGEEYVGEEFADPAIEIPCVNPERTFLEKIFLLHEEFQKPEENIRVDRLSRHLYDVQKIMSTEFADIAFNDMTLYETIVKHRKHFNPLRGMDYALHKPGSIQLIPPDKVLKDWQKDYEDMRVNMIHEESLPFKDLMKEIENLQNRINKIET